jgi:glutamyl-Q tRNA(Asp) synthetase
VTAPYVGRFAPSPSGRLHLGSLTTAVASYLEARQRQGRWLLRIEDLDASRAVAGASARMLGTISHLGFEWDGEVLYQSQRQHLYEAAFERLSAAGLLYPCSCSRRVLRDHDADSGYPGTCRGGASGAGPYAWRLRLDERRREAFSDGLRGWCEQPMAPLGDPIVRRRDTVISYQLAVVVDDADNGVTDVVRGDDLLASTAWQRCLQQALALPAPRYCHLPLVVDADGQKLSKSLHAVPLDGDQASAWLWRALTLLRQQPPESLRSASLRTIWQWAIESWQLARLRSVRSLPDR